MPRLTPIVRRSTLSIRGEYEIEFRRDTDAGDRLGSHVLAEMTLGDLIKLRDVLDWFIDEGQYQE